MKVSECTDLRAKFAKLTPAQHSLMVIQSSNINGLATNSQKRMHEKLLALGLVEKRTRMYCGVEITWYEVPIPIHMAYCRLCSDTLTDEEMANADI